MPMRSSIMCLFQKNLSSTCLEDKRAVFAALQVRCGNICGKNTSVHQFIPYTCTDKSVPLTKHFRSGHAAADFCFLSWLQDKVLSRCKMWPARFAPRPSLDSWSQEDGFPSLVEGRDTNHSLFSTGEGWFSHTRSASAQNLSGHSSGCSKRSLNPWTSWTAPPIISSPVSLSLCFL